MAALFGICIYKRTIRDTCNFIILWIRASGTILGKFVSISKLSKNFYAD